METQSIWHDLMMLQRTLGNVTLSRTLSVKVYILNRMNNKSILCIIFMVSRFYLTKEAIEMNSFWRDTVVNEEGRI